MKHQMWLIPTKAGTKKYSWLHERPLCGARKHSSFDGAKGEFKRYWSKMEMKNCPKLYTLEVREVE